jgi:hypothetical protein
MNSFVATAEKLVSDYRFGVYDILFLPDSFPYGGKPICASWIELNDRNGERMFDFRYPKCHRRG